MGPDRRPGAVMGWVGRWGGGWLVWNTSLGSKLRVLCTPGGTERGGGPGTVQGSWHQREEEKKTNCSR